MKRMIFTIFLLTATTPLTAGEPGALSRLAEAHYLMGMVHLDEYENDWQNKNAATLQKSLEYFQCAADCGHAGAEYRLAMAKLGVYELLPRAHDAEAGLSLLERAAAQNHPQAIFWLIIGHVQGNKLPHDEALAYTYMLRAEELALPYANMLLAYAHLHGVGTPRDDDKALRYMLAHFEGDSPDPAENRLHAIDTLASECEWLKQYARQAKWLKLAVKEGGSYCVHELGMAYLMGQGMKIDDQRAFRLLQCSQSHKLPLLYLASWSVKADEEKAMRMAMDSAYRDDTLDDETFRRTIKREMMVEIVKICIARKDYDAVYMWCQRLAELPAGDTLKERLEVGRGVTPYLVIACHAMGWGVEKDEAKAMQMMLDLLKKLDPAPQREIQMADAADGLGTLFTALEFDPGIILALKQLAIHSDRETRSGLIHECQRMKFERRDFFRRTHYDHRFGFRADRSTARPVFARLIEALISSADPEQVRSEFGEEAYLNFIHRERF